MLPSAALVQRPEGGAGPADSAGCSGFTDGPVQQNQVVFPAGTTQRRHLAKTHTHTQLIQVTSKPYVGLFYQGNSLC